MVDACLVGVAWCAYCIQNVGDIQIVSVPLRKETSIGVCAVKLNLAFAAPSMFRSFLERVLTW